MIPIPIHKHFKEPQERRYEDRYGQYLEFFRDIAEQTAEHIIVNNPPWCWVPLLTYLRCTITNPIYRFPHCHMVRKAIWTAQSAGTGKVTTSILDRTAVEVLCGFRPELVDALYKIDTQWNVPPSRVTSPEPGEFIVTNNGSFHRREVLDFLTLMKDYKPTKRKVVLVPCAADKPYPAPLHQAMLDILPNDYYLAIATGVLGIVPQDMWDKMPLYDSGIPNQWRLFEIAIEYFKQHRHDRVIVYCDFYAHVLKEVREQVEHPKRFEFVISPIKYDDYVNLLSDENLSRLKKALSEEWI